MNPQICVSCKGTKKLCGQDFCPLLAKSELYKKLELKKEIDGQSASVFIGSYGYPKVFVGPMNTAYEAPYNIDMTESWFGLPLEEVINFRSQLYRAKNAVRIDSAQNPNAELSKVQEVALSKKPINSFLEFTKEPKLEDNFSALSAPFGPSGYQKEFELNENISVAKKVDSIVSDELKSADQIFAMYDSEVSIDQIQKILSVGLLGFEKKLVPTRWSITATDDTLGKRMINELRDFDEINEYFVFESNYLDNHFQILLVPGKWSFEQIEFYKPGTIWTKGAQNTTYSIGHETFKGRAKYAENVVGGYYAARLGVCEYLMKIRRQATCFVLREIGEGYVVPVGVWEVRENARNAMKQSLAKFENLESALNFIGSKFKDARNWEKKSQLLPILKSKENFKTFFK